MSQCYILANLVKNPPTGSWDIVQTRKCHADADADADADANANADANRIRTKNNISPSPSVGDIITTKHARRHGW